MGRKKRFLATVLSFTLCLGVCSTTGLNVQAASSKVTSRDWTVYRNDYVYNQLSGDEKAVYDSIDELCKDFISSDTSLSAKSMTFSDGTTRDAYYLKTEIASKLSVNEILNVYYMFTVNNPQYYFLNGGMSYWYSNGVYGLGFEVYARFADGATRAYTTNTIFSSIDNIKSSILKKSKSKAEIVRNLNKYMCDSLDYDYSTSYSYNDDLTQSLYSAVIDNLTVCAGYSKMAEAVLNSCGVSTVGITAPGHMWNRVQLDDEKWYSLDITWNDAIGSYYGELFLNRSDSHIKIKDDNTKAHEAEFPQYYPTCSSDYLYQDSNIEIIDNADGTMTIVDLNSSKSWEQDEKTANEITPPSNDTSNAVYETNTAEQANENHPSNDVPNNSTNETNNSASESNTSTYSSEWVNGKWYSADGSQTYEGTLSWKGNSVGWWVEDSSGWYPVSCWQKIDGYWYYFDAAGYMVTSAWQDGLWLDSNGKWTYEATGFWTSGSGGWSFEDSSGWYASNQWLKVNGSWYYFKGSGYMVTNTKVDGYWIGANGVCQ